jgi:hypothetical protein
MEMVIGPGRCLLFADTSHQWMRVADDRLPDIVDRPAMPGGNSE